MEGVHNNVTLNLTDTPKGVSELIFKKGHKKLSFVGISEYVEEKLSDLKLAQNHLIQSLTTLRNQNSRLKKYELMAREIVSINELVTHETEVYNENFAFRRFFQTCLQDALNLTSFTSDIFKAFQLAKNRLKHHPEYKIYQAKVSRWFADSAVLHSSIAERVKQEKINALTVQWKLEKNNGKSLDPLQKMHIKEPATRPAKIETGDGFLELMDLDPVLEMDDSGTYDITFKGNPKEKTASLSTAQAERRVPLPALRELKSGVDNAKGGAARSPSIKRQMARRFDLSPRSPSTL